MKPLPDINLLRELLTYNPESGELRWMRSTTNRVRVGDTAGCRNAKGYTNVKVDGEQYAAHRIAWALHYGVDPYPHIVDHKEGVEEGNGINNLRLATRSENNYNIGMKSNNTSGHRGVSYRDDTKKWRAYINIGGQKKWLGVYDCVEEAITARLQAEADNNIYVRAS
jgi:hypothetical protein